MNFIRYFSSPLYLFASLTLVAFAAVGVRYADIVFSHFTRWVLLAALVGLLVLQQKIFLAMRGRLGLILGAFVSWCFLTVLWSEAWQLSLFKVSAYAMSVIGFTSLGIWWASRRKPMNALQIFLPVALLTLFAAVLGFVTGGTAVVQSGDLALYRGLTNNSNLMGILVIMAWPLALLGIEQARRKDGNRLLGIAFLGIVLVTLFATNARASIGAVLIITAFYLFGAGLKRYAGLAVMLAVGFTGVLVFQPELIDTVSNRIIYKSKDTDSLDQIFKSREGVWDISLRKAKEGGIVGAGFGVASGMSGLNEFSVFGASRNREKGNTTLAVVEEIGIVGLVLYLLLVSFTIMRPIQAALKTKDPQLRVLLYIVAGTLSGLVFNSQFEAWWLAPGGAATPYYWCMTGVAIGLAVKVLGKKRLQKRAT